MFVVVVVFSLMLGEEKTKGERDEKVEPDWSLTQNRAGGTRARGSAGGAEPIRTKQ